MGYRSTIQIVLIIISVVIVMTYIKPTFESMQSTQEEVGEYQEALASAESFNAELQRLLSVANSFSTSERRALERYIPDTIDTIAVMRDIETIVENNDMLLSGLSADQSDSQSAGRVSAVQNPDAEGIPTYEVNPHVFTVGVTGTYSQFKSLLRDF